MSAIQPAPSSSPHQINPFREGSLGLMLTYEPILTHPDPFPPIGPPTVLHALLAHARGQPERPALTWLDGDDGDGRRVTFAGLADAALRLGGHLRALGLRGERVLLQYADGFDLLQAFLGCLAGGAVPVPVTRAVDVPEPGVTS